MRLALNAGELNWRALRSEMPAAEFEGWREFARREPFGSQHLYKFLAHAFCRLAVAFHSPQAATALRSQDFLWWVDSPDDADDDGMSDADLEAYFDRFSGGQSWT